MPDAKRARHIATCCSFSSGTREALGRPGNGCPPAVTRLPVVRETASPVQCSGFAAPQLDRDESQSHAHHSDVARMPAAKDGASLRWVRRE